MTDNISRKKEKEIEEIKEDQEIDLEIKKLIKEDKKTLDLLAEK